MRNIDDLYPILKPPLRIKWSSSGPLMYDFLEDKVVPIKESAAIFLSMLNGSLSVREIGNDLLFKHNNSQLRDITLTLKSLGTYVDLLPCRSKCEIETYTIDRGWSLYGLPKKRRFPDKLYIYLTEKCNMNCIYCMNRNRKIKNNLDSEIVKKVILDGSKNGLLYVVFTGGEPTLDSELLFYIELCLNNRIVPYFSTNAVLLNSSFVKKLSQLNVPLIQISLDAVSEDIFFKMSRRRNVKRVLSNIQQVLASGIKAAIRVTICDINMSDVENIVSFCTSIGVHKVTLVVAQSFDSHIDVHDLNCLKNIVVKYSTFTNIKLIEDILDKKVSCNNMTSCSGLTNTATVLPDASVAICRELESYSYGNLYENSFSNIWRSSISEIIREYIIPNTDSSCYSCSSYNKCLGGCPAIKLDKGFNLYEKDPRCN